MSIFAVVAMASCKKEVVKTTASNGSANDLTETSYTSKMGGLTMTTFDGSACGGEPGNCFSEVIVEAIIFNDFYNAITDPENEEDIKPIVGHYYEELVKEIDSKLLDGVLDGSLLIKAKYNASIETKFFIFTNGDDAEIAVYPFVNKK